MSQITPSSSDFNAMTSEEKEAFFAELALNNPEISPAGYEFFAFVVGGNVGEIFTANKSGMQHYIDTFSSNPIVIKLTPEQKNVVKKGWSYDSETGVFSQQ